MKTIWQECGFVILLVCLHLWSLAAPSRLDVSRNSAGISSSLVAYIVFDIPCSVDRVLSVLL